MAHKIFINYRREDSISIAGRLQSRSRAARPLRYAKINLDAMLRRWSNEYVRYLRRRQEYARTEVWSWRLRQRRQGFSSSAGMESL